MQTSVQTVSDVEVRVEVEVEADLVTREFRKQLSRLGQRARIKGFRKGKAPKSMVKKLYGGQVASDTARALISDTFKEALDACGRAPVGEPSIEPGVAEEGEPLKYAIRVEVKPDIKLTNWQGLEVSVPPAVVAAEAIDAEIQQLRERHKERVPVDGRGADTGDVVIINTVGELDGAPDERLTTRDLEVRMGAGQMIPGFEDQLMGAKVGDERDLEVVFPEDYHAPEMSAKPAVFRAEVVGLFVEELPELDDDFAQDAGFDTVAALRESIDKRLTGQAESTRARTLDDKLVALLLERHKFNAPPAMVRAQLDGSARRMMQLLQMQGMPGDRAIEMVRSNLEGMNASAERAVKRYLALEALAKQEGKEVDDEALDAEIVKRIEAAGERGAELFKEDDDREQLRLEMQEERALDLLKSRAKITDAEPAAADAAETDATPTEAADDAPADASDSEGGDEK